MTYDRVMHITEVMSAAHQLISRRNDFGIQNKAIATFNVARER
jgi:hypothetical protein